MTLKEYYRRLEQHDWFFIMTDDPNVRMRGLENLNELVKIAITKKSPKYTKLFKNYKDHMFSGRDFGTERKEKPKEPK
jgi:hypothetical protein